MRSKKTMGSKFSKTKEEAAVPASGETKEEAAVPASGETGASRDKCERCEEISKPCLCTRRACCFCLRNIFNPKADYCTHCGRCSPAQRDR
jgi:hypothetical protein